jgi:hypothetical protein
VIEIEQKLARVQALVRGYLTRKHFRKLSVYLNRCALVVVVMMMMMFASSANVVSVHGRVPRCQAYVGSQGDSGSRGALPAISGICSPGIMRSIGK